MKTELIVLVWGALNILKYLIMAVAGTAITISVIFGLVYLISPPERRKWLWEGWKRVGHKIGTFNAHVILGIFYWLIVTPYGIGMRLFGDPLRMRSQQTWINRKTRDLTLKDARRQF
jgi:hypothetical protein